jgi:low temperature requirement protein LtrA
VFGFAITLLAISLEVPKTSADVLHALRGVGSFAITFLMLFGMWRTQFMFFRRYGIEDRKIVWLTGVLLFVLLVFIYPLKFVMGTMFETLLKHAGFPDPTFHRTAVFPDGDVPPLFAAFGFGFAAVFCVFSLMYRHAYALRETLQLDDVEVFDTIEIIGATTKASFVGAALGASYLITVFVPQYAIRLQYAGTAVVLVAVAAILRQRRSRKKRRGAVRRQIAVGVEA